MMRKMKMASLLWATALVAALGVLTREAAAEYGLAHHNGVLSGLGTPNDYVFVNDQNDHLWLFGAKTFEAWVYVEPTDHAMTIASKSKYFWEVSLTGAREVLITYLCGRKNTGVVLPAQKWTHLAVVTLGDSDDSPTNVYVDGELRWFGPVPSAEPCDVAKGPPFIIGNSITSPDEYFEGMIDELRLWNRDLDIEHIRRNRFVGIGDAPDANMGAAITAGVHYKDLVASYSFSMANFAYDFVGGHHGSFQGSAKSAPWWFPFVPYNQVIRLSGGQGDYVVVPDDPATFNQTKGGTIDMWVKPVAFSRSALFSRGSKFGVTISGSGNIGFRFDTTQIATTESIPVGRWTHVAVTWTPRRDSGYQLSIYLNGTLAAKGGGKGLVFPVPTVETNVWIGHGPGALAPFNGYLDEVRFWHGARAGDALRRIMFSSGRGHHFDDDEPLAMWSFEGNLQSPVKPSLSGSLNNGLDNGARFSGYANEEVPGPFDSSFVAHATVLNRSRVPSQNDFAAEYSLRAPYMPIPNGGAGSDTMVFPHGTGRADSFEVMLSIETLTKRADVLRCTVSHGGTHYELFSFDASKGTDILTFVNDEFDKVDYPATANTIAGFKPDSAVYPAPWGFIAPAVPLDNGVPGGVAVDGAWTLTCESLAHFPFVGNAGLIRGWALRFEGMK